MARVHDTAILPINEKGEIFFLIAIGGFPPGTKKVNIPDEWICSLYVGKHGESFVRERHGDLDYDYLTKIGYEVNKEEIRKTVERIISKGIVPSASACIDGKWKNIKVKTWAEFDKFAYELFERLEKNRIESIEVLKRKLERVQAKIKYLEDLKAYE
jgi:hypothetical protein